MQNGGGYHNCAHGYSAGGHAHYNSSQSSYGVAEGRNSYHGHNQ